MQLASRFAKNSPALRSNLPLSDDQMRRVAPSIFADAKHISRSDRYTYIPTSDVLTGLRKEGFEPFAVCQTQVRNDDRRDFTKHLVRLRHVSQSNGAEANEIILLNSHDGTSSYQMLAGMFRFVCTNGLVAGDTVGDIRVRHKGDIVDNVIAGAFTMLEQFEAVGAQRDEMRRIDLNPQEGEAFARAALSLKYEPNPVKPPPITEAQILRPRRMEDGRADLWATFNRVQENIMKGGLRTRTANGRRQQTRPVEGIDQSVKLNRALWVLAEEMRRLKA